jgi:hypothetical protein
MWLKSSGVPCYLFYLTIPFHILHIVDCWDDYELRYSKYVEGRARNIF